MKLLCKEECQDKVTKKLYEKGKEYDFTDERAKEVLLKEEGKYFEVKEKVDNVEKPVEKKPTNKTK